jgi:Uma2 family endonuclease
MACRPLPEYEVWSPDVGLTTRERWNATRNDDWLAGSPELAIEVLSPSNTKREMEDRRATLFAGGCQQFWTVDARSRTVTVSTPDGAHQTYTAADSIPLEPYATVPFPVAEIFDAE